MSDLIDRQQAIKAVELGITYAKLIDTETGELLEPFKASNDELKRAVQRIKNLPSAEPTFDARDTQYNLPIGTDLISRQQAIDDIWTVSPLAHLDSKWVDRWLRQLPSAQPYTIHSDGRLWITVDDIDKVTAVVVDEYKSKFCKQFYEDEQPKMGRWIHHPEIGWGETWLCDQCGEKTTSTVMGKPRANFCPNCGAKMEVTE